MERKTFQAASCGPAIALLSLVSPAHAAGVDAGTLIQNTASATYSTGGQQQSADSNTVTVLVDELLDVTVASNDGAPVTLSGSAVLAFTVTNIGNGPEAFSLTADPAIAGNGFDAAISGIALDSNSNGLYDQGVDTLLTNGSVGSTLAADGSEVVFVLVNSPNGIADGDASQVRLRADAITGTGAPGTVIAGAGPNGSDAVIGSTGASGDDLGEIVASMAAVSLVKAATIVDPFGGSQAVPGAVVTFEIIATVSGSGSVDNLTITDTIPAGTTYQPGTLALDGAVLTDAADADAGSFAAGAISVTSGAATAGSLKSVTFDVSIDQ